MAGACSTGNVDLGSSTPTIYTCVTKDSRNVTVSVKGSANEAWPFKGYVRFKLKRVHPTNEVWIDVDTKDAGYWADSTYAEKKVTFSNVAYIGSVMDVTAEFYKNSNYTGKYSSSASHMFER